jgi:hypothetical protein
VTDDTPGDPYLRALVAIGAELTAIRQALEAMDDGSGTEPSGADDRTDDTTLACRCGATFKTRTDATEHARTEHGAPAGAEQDILETDDSN